MNQKCKFGTLFIIINTIILGVIACFSHYAYQLSGESVIVGLFNPVNESVWEHLKFMFFPNLLWWIVVYFVQKRKCDVNPQKWIIASAVSLIAAPLAVIMLYYFYTEALGLESIVLDIALVFICYFFALMLAAHAYKYVQSSTLKVVISILTIAFIFLAFIKFTFNPPHFPIFMDTTTGKYGIQ